MPPDALTTALDAIHAAVTCGRFDELAALTDIMVKTEAQMQSATPAQMRHIQALATRNARCLEAAIKGVRSAQRRFAELRAARAGHATYDQHGHRAPLGTAAGQLRQRI